MRPTLQLFSDRLTSLSAAVGTLGLIFVVCVIVVDVIGRNFTSSLFGALDLTTMTMVIVVFGGMALCGKENGHIVVDIFEASFPSALNRAIDIASALLGAVIFLLIGFAVFKTAQLSQMLKLSTNLLQLPTAWFQYSLCGLSVCSALVMVLRAADIAFVDDTGRANPGSEN